MDKKDRIKLRSLSVALPDLVYVGKEGLTENVLKQINDNLFAHELIKIKVQKAASDDIEKIASEIELKALCEVVCVIGSKIICYKFSKNEKIKHIL